MSVKIGDDLSQEEYKTCTFSMHDLYNSYPVMATCKIIISCLRKIKHN